MKSSGLDSKTGSPTSLHFLTVSDLQTVIDFEIASYLVYPIHSRSGVDS